LFISLQTKVKL